MNQAKNDRIQMEGGGIEREADDDTPPERVEQNPAGTKAKSLSQQLMMNKDDIIKECAPTEAFDDNGIIDMIHIMSVMNVSGVEACAYKGNVFVKISPPEIVNVHDDGRYVTTVVVKYEPVKQP